MDNNIDLNEYYVFTISWVGLIAVGELHV